jgi:hypothetical protein
VEPNRKLNWKWIAAGVVAAVILFIAITQTTARRDMVRDRNAGQRPLIDAAP